MELNDNMVTTFLKLVSSALWAKLLSWNGRTMSHQQFLSLMQLAQEQAVVGLVSQGLMDSGVRLEREDALNLFALQQGIRQRNRVMDEAVVQLCKMMNNHGIRFFVFKGQTIATYYHDSSLRQSGDIDFYVYPDGWDKALSLFRNELGISINDLHSSKDVGFEWNGVLYEMHRQITLFTYPPHSRYWKKTVMPEIMASPYLVNIDGCEIPTLTPTYNALFIFIHIFQHLIADGIGLRQFCDWALLLNNIHNEKLIGNEEGCDDLFEVEILERHLKGLGLRKAYSGLGAILTDYLELSEECFPFAISDTDHRRVTSLWNNMLKMGNFGHNVEYKHSNMMAHGLEHVLRMTKQSRELYHYAPAEAWWHIPNIFKWWGMKIWRMMRR
ncbi:MAG: nucleotidyltransferase family protein [Bacteroidaceae bacterium]|nr:nucleotidyltransferase family protein [Bacteroidaceae bacterium]